MGFIIELFLNVKLIKMTELKQKQEIAEMIEECSETALSHKDFVDLLVIRIINYYKNQRNEYSGECGQSHIGNIKESG